MKRRIKGYEKNLVVLNVFVVLICLAISAYAQESRFSDLVKLYKRGVTIVFVPKSTKIDQGIYATAWYSLDKTLTGGTCFFVNVQCPNKIQYVDAKLVRVEKGTLRYESVPSYVVEEPGFQIISETKDEGEYAFVVRFCSKMGKN